MKQLVKAMLLLLFLLSFGANGRGYAKLQGQASIDSFLKELGQAKEDTNKCNLLISLSNGYKWIAPDKGILYGQQSLELATKLDWKIGIGMAYSALGSNFQRKSDYSKALEYYFKSLGLAEELGNKRGIASLNGNIGLIYKMQNDYSKALEYYSKALKLKEVLGDKAGIASTTGNIGNIYADQKDYAKALEYDFKALKVYEELGDKSGIATNTGNIGNAYKEQKNYTMAVEYQQKALKMSEELGDKYLIASNLINIGETYIAIIEDTAAKAERVKSTLELSVNKYQPTVAIPKGKAALLQGAIDYTQRSLGIGKEMRSRDIIQYCYKNLSIAYKLKGDYKRAMEYTDSSRVINDSVYSQENRNKLARLENKRKEYGDSLKAADAKIAADVKAAHRRNYELIGVGVLVLALGFIFMLTRKNKLLDKEKKESEGLLLNILPEEVAGQLKKTGAAAARQFDDVTVLFTDFVNFTQASERMKPDVLLEELNICFKAFDEITSKFNIEKIKTIGDAYLAVGGLPTADPKHAENTVRAAIEINKFMQDRLAKLGERTFAIRIGINSGSVVAGIVGVKKFAYDIWGDTVNTAARMEQKSEAGKINISATTYELVKDKIACEYRGEVDVKGKGVMKMYYVG